MFLDSKKKDEELKKSSQPSITTTSDPQSKGGRPLGTTDAVKFNQKHITMSCLDAIAHEFHEQKNVAKREGRNEKKGYIERIIEAKRKEFNLPDDVKLDKEAIRARHYRGNLSVASMGPISPMAEVEPQLVELIIRMSRIQRCLAPIQCLLLANDLIAGTKYEDKVLKFKELRNKVKYD